MRSITTLIDTFCSKNLDLACTSTYGNFFCGGVSHEKKLLITEELLGGKYFSFLKVLGEAK